MDLERARRLVTAERGRIEEALDRLAADRRADFEVRDQQPGEDGGVDVGGEELEAGLVIELRHQLEAVGRAEARLADGTYGRSVESGEPIPDERLEADPLAERTVAEQSRYDRGL